MEQNGEDNSRYPQNDGEYKEWCDAMIEQWRDKQREMDALRSMLLRGQRQRSPEEMSRALSDEETGDWAESFRLWDAYTMVVRSLREKSRRIREMRRDLWYERLKTEGERGATARHRKRIAQLEKRNQELSKKFVDSCLRPRKKRKTGE